MLGFEGNDEWPRSRLCTRSRSVDVFRKAVDKTAREYGIDVEICCAAYAALSRAYDWYEVATAPASAHSVSNVSVTPL